MVVNSIKIEIKDELKLHEEFRAKMKKKGIRKPVFEMKKGDSYSRSSKKWVKRSYVIDREKNTYCEVVYTDDGRIIHANSEPLSEHVKHGDAKKEIFVDEHSSDKRKTEETDDRTKTRCWNSNSFKP